MDPDIPSPKNSESLPPGWTLDLSRADEILLIAALSPGTPGTRTVTTSPPDVLIAKDALQIGGFQLPAGKTKRILGKLKTGAGGRGGGCGKMDENIETKWSKKRGELKITWKLV